MDRLEEGLVSKISQVRVVLGGLLAGVVLNVLHFVLNGLILGDQWAAATESLGRAVPEGAGVMILVHHIGYITWNFLM